MNLATRFSSTSLQRTTPSNFLRRVFAILAILAFQLNIAIAQQVETNSVANKPDAQPVMASPAASQQMSQQATGTVTLPAGTKLQLGVVRPISVKRAKPGDTAYLQVTFPVSVGSEMLVPPGTYLQGTIGRIVRRDSTRALLEFELSSASLIYSTGYTVNFTGAIDAKPTWAELRAPKPGDPQDVPVMAATGTTPPPLPTPSLGNGPRNALIAVGVAGVVGLTVLALAAHHTDVYMESGTPIQIVLPTPLPLERERVTAAVQQYSVSAALAPPAIVQPKPKLCYTAGTLGTPDTVIPGTPGTPPIVIPGGPGMPDTIIPGTPATPDTVIPGTPGTAGGYYPCR